MKKIIILSLLTLHVFGSEKKPELTVDQAANIIGRTYRQYCHAQNTKYPSFNKENRWYKKFCIFDDRIDTHPCYQKLFSNELNDAILTRRYIKMDNFYKVVQGEIIFFVKIDKYGDSFGFGFIDTGDHYKLILAKKDDKGDLTIPIQLKKRDLNGNALKNADGSYILEEE